MKFFSKEYLQQKNLNIVSPEQLRIDLSMDLSVSLQDLFILGDILNRALIVRITECDFEYFPIQNDEISDSFLESHGSNITTIIKNGTSYTIRFQNAFDFINKLEKPHVKLISLFHKENFPLPRFPLGISDIASAIRKAHLGRVSLCDMQFEKSVEEIVGEMELEKPDVLGISATFGQQDLLEGLINSIQKIPNYNPLVIFGGSLSTLNSENLLRMFPNTLVARGYGETTMQDVVKYWHGLILKSEINYISYFEKNEIITTEQRKDDKNVFANPELDLLDQTLKFKGVMQLESSRGCTYHCSFCPRSHKGKWSGETGSEFQKLIPFVKHIFDKYPDTTPKIFLVDEEFIGYKYQDIGVQNRAVQVAELLNSYGFKFESSTRIDQVYRPIKGDQWQIERIDFWKKLVELGLDRMLFGVESGVDSILKRFNKQSTAYQNTIAIRILTTIGVPLRLTYITFDPLMTLDELIMSYEFQGRSDVLLKANSTLSANQILESVFDENYVNENSSGLPLYSEITYLLVSMESLLGSAYLKLVENEGLAGEQILSMGKRNARYKDENIGLISLYSQKWIDRNFALDYLLKSIMKISNDSTRNTVSVLRARMKNFSYSLLGKMLALITGDLNLMQKPNEVELHLMNDLMHAWNYAKYKDVKENAFIELLSNHFSLLVEEFTDQLILLKPLLKKDDYAFIQMQVENWKIKNDWHLINAK